MITSKRSSRDERRVTSDEGCIQLVGGARLFILAILFILSKNPRNPTNPTNPTNQGFKISRFFACLAGHRVWRQEAKWARQILRIMLTGRVSPKWWRQKAEAMSSKSLRLCSLASLR
jgi:hypothetical protein